MASHVGPFVFGLLPFGILLSLSLADLSEPEWLIAVSGVLFCVASCVTMQLFTCVSTVRLLEAGRAGRTVRAVNTRPPQRGSFAGLDANPWFQFLRLAALLSGGIMLYNVVSTDSYTSVLSR